ncbi:MAG: CoA-binding protein [Dehalococcoidia bacterium]|nr:CoA-binding protein [Dehalococcoidia bacterium]
MLFKEKLKEFKPIFYPKSIAVVGASSQENKMGSRWVKGLISAGFAGPVYPVASSGGTVWGLKIFPDLKLIPGEVDYVIASIPRQAVLEFLDDCIAKRVKAVQFFTAGFSEAGKAQWRELEQQMLRKARENGIRIIGPNCLGVYCPEHKIPCGPSPRGKIGISGSVGFVSQSGSIANKLVEIGIARHINYSEGVSFGNGIDLDASNFLQYLAADSKTAVVGAYLEGTRNGRRLFSAMKEVAKTKPLVIWKGGRTEVGAQAAMSHTGSLASSAAIWSAAIEQAGAIEVHSLEELTDSLLIFQQLGRYKGGNVAVIGGLADGGGGISVSAGDTCMEAGLELPALSSKTREQLTNLLGEVGSILHNPVDASAAQFHGLSTLFQTIELVAEDPIIELLLIQEDVDVLLAYSSGEELKRMNDFFVEFRNRQNKPLVLVLPPGSAEPERLSIEKMLLEASIPVFCTMERAARAIMSINKYFSSR